MVRAVISCSTWRRRVCPECVEHVIELGEVKTNYLRALPLMSGVLSDGKCKRELAA